MRYLGMILIFFAAYGISRAVSQSYRRRLAEGEGFHALLLFMKGELSRYARPVNEWCRLFSDEALEQNGFLPHLRAHGDLAAAYKEATLSLGEEEKKILAPLFSSFGRAYREEELEALASAESALAGLLATRAEELSRTERAVKTVTAAAALTLVLLLV